LARRKDVTKVAEYRTISAVWVRISDRLGAVRMKLFHTVGEQRDGSMISAVFEPKKEIPVCLKRVQMRE
jgi:hypothetical protein